MPVERRLERVASRAHGVITRAEARGTRVTDKQIDRRLQNGSLIAVHPGVYRIGHLAPSADARYMAASKACGPGSRITGRAGGHLLGLIGEAPETVDVLSPRERRIAGISVHRTRKSPIRGRLVRGIPVTSVARTLIAMAPELDDETLGWACHHASSRYRCSPGQIESELRTWPNAKGRRRLQRMVSGDDPLLLSRLEREFVRKLRRERLPVAPVANRVVGDSVVDFRYPELRLTIELDSYRFHGSRRAWERDRMRERAARARGDTHVRFTWGDVFERWEETRVDCHRLLGQDLAVPATSRHSGTGPRRGG